MNIKPAFLLFALFIGLNGTLLAQISNPSGLIEPVEPEDIWAKTLEGNHYNEFWNYQFYLDDGMTVHITFSAANFGTFKSPVSGAQISIYNFDGELYQASKEYPIGNLIQDRQNYRFQLQDDREIYFQGQLPNEHRVKINTSKSGISYDIDLRLSNIHKGVKWGDGFFRIGNDRIGIITHIPFANVRGHVTVNDTRKDVRGTAYMDHTFQNQTTAKLVHSGYRFVHHSNKQNWDLLFFMLPKHTDDYSTIGYRLKKQDGQMEIMGIERIERMTEAEAFGEKIARIIDLRLEGSAPLRVSRTQDNQKFSVLGELGWLAKKAAKSFLGGEVINIRGEAILMESGNRPKRGYYNFYKID